MTKRPSGRLVQSPGLLQSVCCLGVTVAWIASAITCFIHGEFGYADDEASELAYRVWLRTTPPC
jgi:hypothetical protein